MRIHAISSRLWYDCVPVNREDSWSDCRGSNMQYRYLAHPSVGDASVPTLPPSHARPYETTPLPSSFHTNLPPLLRILPQVVLFPPPFCRIRHTRLKPYQKQDCRRGRKACDACMLETGIARC